MTKDQTWLLQESWMNLQIALANAHPEHKPVVADALAAVDHAITTLDDD